MLAHFFPSPVSYIRVVNARRGFIREYLRRCLTDGAIADKDCRWNYPYRDVTRTSLGRKKGVFRVRRCAFGL